ncbi:MAG TPA: DNA mismatch repair protein, partial [Polyangiaceae bacterium]|nr:DNA mismatch repair protein [Polyangiaceae bacterium]
SGAPSAAFSQSLEAATLPHSGWDARAFESQLFLGDLIRGCFQVEIEGRPHPIDQQNLARILSRPPSDSSVVRFRCEVLAELARSPDRRREFERVYASLSQFRMLLESPPLARRLDGSRRRLDILTAVKASIDAMACSFHEATSGLRRLREFGVETLTKIEYQRLSDLLHYEENLSTLDVRVRLGFDGRVRGLEMLRVRENEGNWFYASPAGRFFAKISALFRGYRFSEQELLARLIDGVYDGLEGALVQLFQVQGDMEFYLAALAFRDLAERNKLQVCLPTMAEIGEAPGGVPFTRDLRGLYNPLLLLQSVEIVPCDIVTERHDEIMIVTGPNSGGKTRLLQAFALAQLLGQCGFFVPARSANLRIAPGLFVSLIEEATADQSEGRLGMELIRIRSLFEELKVGSMVVLDELCSGTNPSEGEEIFELVISLLSELDPQAFITTHFLQLAARIAGNPPVPRLSFFQVELDKRQIPTYGFVRGVAETSLAHRTAARLGVTREELLALVESSKRASAREKEGRGSTDGHAGAATS